MFVGVGWYRLGQQLLTPMMLLLAFLISIALLFYRLPNKKEKFEVGRNGSLLVHKMLKGNS